MAREFGALWTPRLVDHGFLSCRLTGTGREWVYLALRFRRSQNYMPCHSPVTTDTGSAASTDVKWMRTSIIAEFIH